MQLDATWRILHARYLAYATLHFSLISLGSSKHMVMVPSCRYQIKDGRQEIRWIPYCRIRTIPNDS